jgi:hypothetical protein
MTTRLNIRTKRKIASALRRHARSMESWVRWSDKTSKMRPHRANAFLLGVMLDRSIVADRAWDSADWICWALGESDDASAVWRTLASMESRRLRGFLRFGNGGAAFHRHYKTFARLLPQAARHVLKQYRGDPRRIWRSRRDVGEIRDRLVRCDPCYRSRAREDGRAYLGAQPRPAGRQERATAARYQARHPSEARVRKKRPHRQRCVGRRRCRRCTCGGSGLPSCARRACLGHRQKLV